MKCPKCHFENPADTRFCNNCATPLQPSEEISISQTKTLQIPMKEITIGSTFAGRYQVIEELGRGGMGVVYKAKDNKLKRTVALKFLTPKALGSEEEKTRFVHEAQAAAALDHPNICTVYEIDEAEEPAPVGRQTFIAMAYIKGQSLKEKIESGPLKLDEALDIAIQVAEGLQEAHEKRIVHRDIKSTNIMVTEKGQAKIMDFGLAKLAEGTKLTKAATIMGTVAYMSPEQVRGETVDHRTDIWSLGVVLHEMVTGQLPFKGEYEQAVMYSILNEGSEPLTSVRSGIPLEFERIVNKCLEKDPTERYQTTADLKADLKRLKRDISSGKAAVHIATAAVPHPFQRLLRKTAVPLTGVIIAMLLLLLLSSNRRAVKKWLGFEAIPAEKHLAVLPFTIVGGDSEDQAFCDGLVETFTSKLTQLERFQGSLWVVPASEVRERGITSVSEARRAFGVNLVVTESMQRIDDMLQLTLNLVDTKTLRQLRSEVIKGGINNLSDMHNNAVIKLVGILDIELQPQTSRVLTTGGPTVPDVSELYVKARGYMQRYEKEENLDTAISLFKRAIDKDSSYALAYAGLGEAYWRKYKLTKDPNWVKIAQSYCNRAIQLSESLAPVHVTLGIIYRDTGRYEDAIKEFQQALLLDPVNSDAHRELASAYEKLGKLEKAEATYKKAIELRPSYWAGYSYLGVFYYFQGRYTEAEKMFLKVTELTPDNIRGYNLLGAVYLQMGRIDLATAMLKKSLAIKPDAVTYSNLGTLYFYQRRYADATAMYEEAIKLGENRYTIWGNLADTYRYMPGYSEKEREAYQRAIQLAEKELEINPKDAHLHGNLAFYYAILGNHKNALTKISKARKLAPNDVWVLRKCVQVFELANQRDQALQALEEFIKRGGSIDEVHKDPDLSELRKDPLYQQLVMKEESTVFDSPDINK
ncbi:MAG: protein kinase [Candidatus Aminicenantia bacterium]